MIDSLFITFTHPHWRPIEEEINYQGLAIRCISFEIKQDQELSGQTNFYLVISRYNKEKNRWERQNTTQIPDKFFPPSPTEILNFILINTRYNNPNPINEKQVLITLF